MFAVVITLAIVLALAFLAAGGSKLASASPAVHMADHLGIARDHYRLIGVPEVLGAAGVLVGLQIVAVGVAAAVGLAALTIGAAVTHGRAHDAPKDMAPAVGLAVIALAYALLRVVTS